MTIYEITAELRALLELAEDPETDPETFADTLEAIVGELEDKADGYAKVIRQLEYDAAALGSEIKRLTARKKAIEENAAKMKNRLRDAMTAAGKRTIKTKLFNFSVRLNPPAVSVLDASSIPPEYFTTPEPVLDKAKIKDDLKAGKEVPGATLTQGESLTIR